MSEDTSKFDEVEKLNKKLNRLLEQALEREQYQARMADEWKDKANTRYATAARDGEALKLAVAEASQWRETAYTCWAIIRALVGRPATTQTDVLACQRLLGGGK